MSTKAKNYSQILQAISSKLQRETVELIYKIAVELQPQSKEILDKALENYPVGDRNPADHYLNLVNEIINVAFAVGYTAGCTAPEGTKSLARELQESMKAQGIPKGGLLEGVTAKDLLMEIPGYNGGPEKAN
jgi:hypothetical protein